jgi:hypothetical protein
LEFQHESQPSLSEMNNNSISISQDKKAFIDDDQQQQQQETQKELEKEPMVTTETTRTNHFDLNLLFARTQQQHNELKQQSHRDISSDLVSLRQTYWKAINEEKARLQAQLELDAKQIPEMMEYKITREHELLHVYVTLFNGNRYIFYWNNAGHLYCHTPEFNQDKWVYGHQAFFHTAQRLDQLMYRSAFEGPLFLFESNPLSCD